MVSFKLTYLCILVAIISAASAVGNKSKLKVKKEDLLNENGCFCKLQGEVDDCSCEVKSIDSLNNHMIYPRLKSLLSRNYFRYFKVNLNKVCPFWSDDSKCAMRNCAVNICPEDQLPDGLKKSSGKDKYKEESQEDCQGDDLGYLNTTISQESKKAFENWTKYDDAQETFCEMDDDTSPDMKYVDLLLNPERYTGYKGVSPHRIWNSIYNENCFNTPIEQPAYNPQALTDYSLEGLCLEKRAFYRMISGLHTSINIHLCHEYLFPAKTCYGQEDWGPNLDEFQRRFDHTQSNGRGPQWLKNLYFTYLVELRAIAKAAPYFEEEGFFTGDNEEDTDVREGVKDFLKVVKEFPNQFDESKLFVGNKKEARALKIEFRDHFRNISRIMDCVGCEKCKLWGKLQIQGMGTALKILFSGDGMGPLSTVNAGSKKKFQLRRTEIVSLFNAFGRLSMSIHAIEEFRKLLR